MSPQQITKHADNLAVYEHELNSLREKVIHIGFSLKENRPHPAFIRENHLIERDRNPEDPTADTWARFSQSSSQEISQEINQQHEKLMQERKDLHAQRLAEEETLFRSEILARMHRRQERHTNLAKKNDIKQTGQLIKMSISAMKDNDDTDHEKGRTHDSTPSPSSVNQPEISTKTKPRWFWKKR